MLKLQGVDLTDPAVVATIKHDLEPDAAILADDIQHALGEGFSTAGRAATTVACIFVAGGALSSLKLPRSRKPESGEAQVIAAGH
jgi:hypothetical protein